ncbi:MAG: LysM peptidoglycan-binding domain-containing protein [Planctomycetes bacterium]|nr:LysM peptidoglycan-binding domain-containing protein [Planctomycetota bacterium]MCP4770547.1 LysM peptidoglycan-binding domain-containing protein [Planctomycetota bacterium]MCP4860362.1 LysM peptidoglycan-binding domain-containing protein [Planctomycetota bacterium]
MLLSVVVFKGLKPRGGESPEAPPLIIHSEIPLGPVNDNPQDQESELNKGEGKWPVKPVENDNKEKTFEKVQEISLSPVNPRNDLKNDKKPGVNTPKRPVQPEVRRYTIESGDTLSEIAQKQLGSSKPSFVQGILDMNPGVTAQNIKPGDELILPARGSRNASVSEAGAKTKDSVKLSGGRTHTISSGDSLWKISRTYYGPDNEEKGIARIVAANSQLKNGKNSVLKIGQVLSIPK